MNMKPPVDKNSVSYRQNLVKVARTNMLIAAAFTVMNVALLLFRTNRYFLFSMTLPYYLTFFGYMFDFFRVSTYTFTGLTLAVVPVWVMIMCWLVSKKYPMWLWGGVVMFALDTITLLAMILWSGDATGMLVDIVFHGWVMFTLIRGLMAVYNLRKPVPEMPEEVPVEKQEEFSETENPVIDTDCPV